jgi:hypothetical protein
LRSGEIHDGSIEEDQWVVEPAKLAGMVPDADARLVIQGYPGFRREVLACESSSRPFSLASLPGKDAE